MGIASRRRPPWRSAATLLGLGVVVGYFVYRWEDARSLDQVRFAGLSPERAAQAMTVPAGFEVKLFAGEPDVRQPIAMCLDDRGRLWVAEAYCYPTRRADKDANDRILIFEDTTGEGKFTKRTVFMEGLNLVSGLDVGFGGVWIGAAPYLLYVPIKEGEDRPAGPPQILLDGWQYEDTHDTLNTFIWGPDGWLYGCQGVYTHSHVGKPGTPDDQRTMMNAGVWRYHPTRHIFEPFAHGTSNPWGLDFDEHGQAFISACVVPHAFHVVQGGRYQRQELQHYNPHTYADIQSIADHVHWQGADPWAGNNRSDSAGGGHAHCGLMIYQGGAWPEEYRGRLFLGNIHGHRFNMDFLKPQGSSFVASHGPDFILANDAWARFITIKTGPDGNAYFLDWYDQQACHTHDDNAVDRSNGRIYKVSYRGAASPPIDLARMSDRELTALLQHKNNWHVRHALRLLQERGKGGTAGAIAPDAIAALVKTAFDAADETRRLRGLWALHAVGALDEARLARALADAGPYIRAWAVQFALETPGCPEALRRLMEKMAAADPSAVVRLCLAAGLQRMPLDQRWPIAGELVRHAEDAADRNLPLMYWYGCEPLAGADPERALALALEARVPPVPRFMVRRIASAGAPGALDSIIRALGETEAPAKQQAILLGLHEALAGRQRVPMPAQWTAVFGKLSRSADSEVRDQALALAVTFGDAQAFTELRCVVLARDGDIAARRHALAALLGASDPGLAPVLHELVGDATLRTAAIRGLAAYDDPATPGLLLSVYATLTADERRDAVNTLAARPAYGRALMEAIASRKLPAADVPAEVVRQLRNLNDPGLDARIAEVWGSVRATRADRAQQMADWKRRLAEPFPPADLALGRAVFARTCQQCHTLYGIGGKVGPDITGSNRANLDYLLENILDPNAIIPNDYKATVFALKDGRIVTGIVRGETPAAYTVLTQNETLLLSKDEVEARKPSDVSMMPEDLLKRLSEPEARALVAYLRHPTQTPILATLDTAGSLFSGRDLAGWEGDPTLWRVENGAIVGRSPRMGNGACLKSHMTATDFRLRFKLKLPPGSASAGIYLRSDVLPDGSMKGLRAEIASEGQCELIEDHGRGVLCKWSHGLHAAGIDADHYEIIATGSRIQIIVNGERCADLDDAVIARRGIFALRLPAGGSAELRISDINLQVLPQKPVEPKE